MRPAGRLELSCSPTGPMALLKNCFPRWSILRPNARSRQRDMHWRTALPRAAAEVLNPRKHSAPPWASKCGSPTAGRGTRRNASSVRTDGVRIAAERVRDVGDRLLGTHAVPGLVERRGDHGDPEL